MARAVSRLRGWWRALLDVFRARDSIVFILASLGALYLVGLLVPQRDRLEPAQYAAWHAARPGLVGVLEVLGATDVFRSAPMLVLLAAFAVSLVAVLAERIPRTIRRIRVSEGLTLDAERLDRRSGTIRVPVRDPEEALATVMQALERRGYAVWRPSGRAARAVRFRFAPIGFLMFHGALVLLLLGGIAVDLTRFSGFALIAEGETFDGAGPYAPAPRRPRIGDMYPRTAFKVLALRAERAREGDPVALEAEVLLGGEALPSRVAVNEPIERGPVSILIMDARPTPLFVCEVAGRATDGAYVKLDRTRDGVNRFPLQGCGMDVEVRLAREPLAVSSGPGMPRRVDDQNLLATMPFGLDVTARSVGRAPLSGRILPGGELVDAAGEFRIRVPEVRLAGLFQLTRERGGELLWGAFVLGLVGLVARLWLFRREVVCAIAGDGRTLLVATASDVPDPDAQRRAVAHALDLVRATPEPEPQARGCDVQQ